LHYKECLKYGTTNRWGNLKDVLKGFKCEFGKIVELVKEEPKAEKEQQLQPAEEIPEETIPETSFYKNLTWLWVTLLIITILSVVYFLKRH
jgi:hypothetical protein